MVLEEFDVTDMFCAAEDAEVEVDEENQLNRWLSFFPPPVNCGFSAGESRDEPVVLWIPKDDARPCKSFTADDVDASNSKL